MTPTGYLLMALAISVEYLWFPILLGIVLVGVGLGMMKRR